jgi:hypothetical protein
MVLPLLAPELAGLTIIVYFSAKMNSAAHKTCDSAKAQAGLLAPRGVRLGRESQNR